MKRMFKYFALILIIGSVPLILASGQDTKSEKKIKVIIDEGAGPETVLDTVFTGGNLPETVTLKNGKVIFIADPGKGMTHLKQGAGGKNVTVTVTSDDKGEKKEEKKIIVMSSDSMTWTAKSPEKGKHVYVYTATESNGDEPGTRVIVSKSGTSEDIWEEEGDNKVIVIKNGKMMGSEDGKTFNIKIESDDVDSDMEKTKFVIAKDGLVITIEGNDEEKAKEILKLVESKLDIKSDESSKKEIVKEETKKTVKK